MYKIIGMLSNLEIAEMCARSGANCGSLFLDLRFRELVKTLLADHPAHLDGKLSCHITYHPCSHVQHGSGVVGVFPAQLFRNYQNGVQWRGRRRCVARGFLVRCAFS